MTTTTVKLSYSVPEAAAATGLSPAYISNAIDAGRLKAKTTKERGENAARQGKRVILATELQAFLDSMADAS